MIATVAYMSTNVAYTTGNLRPMFSNLSFFTEIMIFRDFQAPPIFENVPFLSSSGDHDIFEILELFGTHEVAYARIYMITNLGIYMTTKV